MSQTPVALITGGGAGIGAGVDHPWPEVGGADVLAVELLPQRLGAAPHKVHRCPIDWKDDPS